MDTAREDRIARLSAALEELADEDLPALIAEARAGAREKARALLEAAFVDALLDRAAAPRPAGGGSGGEGWWVYGVIAARDADRVSSGLEGVEPGSEVEAVVVGELAALASPVPMREYGDERIRDHLEDLQWVERTARAHEAVLDAALGTTTVVPLRLCTIYRDRPGVERYRHNLARVLTAVGVARQNTGKRAEAEGHFRRAAELFRGLAEAHPEVASYRNERGITIWPFL